VLNYKVMIVERACRRFRRQRAAAQLIEEALLLSVALVALSLLVGGIGSILKEAGGFTSNIWSSISSTLNNLFNSAFQW
jgi:Flp pilus assembly pilin Flp